MLDPRPDTQGTKLSCWQTISTLVRSLARHCSLNGIEPARGDRIGGNSVLWRDAFLELALGYESCGARPDARALSETVVAFSKSRCRFPSLYEHVSRQAQVRA